MIVVGYDDVIKVYIYINDLGLVLLNVVIIGELLKIKIDNMREEYREFLIEVNDEEDNKDKKEEVVIENEKKKYGFIIVVMGDGIVNIFKDLGINYVIEGG